MRNTYFVPTSADVGLVAATPKTVLFALAPATFGMDLLSFWVSMLGTDPTQAPVLWEICSLSAATNSTIGTGNTTESANIVQEGGRAITVGFTAGRNCSSEPTVLVPIKSGNLTPNGGYYEYEYGFNRSPDNDVSKGFALRLTTPTGAAAVNCRAGLRFART